MPFYDASAAIHRKVKFQDIPTAGQNLAVIFPITFNKSISSVQDVNLLGLFGWRMDAGTDDRGAEFLFVLTDQVNLSADPKVKIDIYTLTASADNDVLMRCTARYVAAGEGLDKAIDETIDVLVNVTGTVGIRHTVEFTLDRTNILATDAIFIIITRIGTDPTDNYGGRMMFASSGGLEFGT